MTNELVDALISLGFFALAGVVTVMVLIRLAPQRRAQRSLESKPGMEGPAIAARPRIRERLVYLWICGVFVVFGVLQLIPHERYGVLWALGVLAAYSMMVRMLLAIRAGDKDAEEAVSTHAEPR